MSNTQTNSGEPLTVAVLGGGNSAEATVSRSSARAVAEALAQHARYRVVSVELDDQIATQLIELDPDVVFPALHGPPGEDGTVQGLLEMLGLRYVGSSVQPSAFAMDKAVAKQIFARAGLPVAPDEIYQADPTAEDLGAGDCAADIRASLGERVVIKPMQQGSALGVTPLPNGGDLHEAVRRAFELGDRILVEPFIEGREITVGVLDLHGAAAEAHPVIEIKTATNEWYDYENRYAEGGSQHVMPAELPASDSLRLQEIALAAHQSLGLRDLSRADFIVPAAGEPVLLEVNTLPGMTATSLYPDGARGLGLEFPDLLSRLVESALARGRSKVPTKSIS